jgi:hypothetical protein
MEGIEEITPSKGTEKKVKRKFIGKRRAQASAAEGGGTVLKF